MIKKVIDKILDRKGLKIITAKEFDNMIKYRATRGELKHSIDDNNILVEYISKKATVKDLEELLTKKEISFKPNLDKNSLINIFINSFKKEFKKSEK